MKVILVAVTTSQDRYDIEYSLDELKKLAEALNMKTVDRFFQKAEHPNARTYVGKGKLNEIKLAVFAKDADAVIFNDELTYSQLRNLKEELQIECIDRSYLILRIFEQRASTPEAKLEIRLAKNLYLLPRIAGLREKESRIGGSKAGVTNRGAGESQTNLDRRRLLAEIQQIRKSLQQIEKRKKTERTRRQKNDIPIVALVGYTNSGKSSTMNSLLKYVCENGKTVVEKDQLFATLSTYNRKISFEQKEFILEDTIGFVSRLPHTLIHSFYQTLAEIRQADLILHVIDSSSPYINEQFQVVSQVLYTLQADRIPMIFLLNKWDQTTDETLCIPGQKYLTFSNKTQLHIRQLLDLICQEVGPSTLRVRLLIPYSKGNLSHILEEGLHIYRKEYQEFGIYYDVELPVRKYPDFRMYDLDQIVQ